MIKILLYKTRSCFSFLGLIICLSSIPFGNRASAQTVLGQGDISVIGFNANQVKGLAFVTWVPLAVNTEIFFSENGFNNAAASSTNGNINWQKTYGRWKNTSGATISAGTVITLTRETASTGSFEVYTAAGAATPIQLTLSNVTGGHIFAHQGGTLPTVASASATYNAALIYGLGYQSASSATTWLASGPATGGNSVLPTDLVAPNSIFVAGNANGSHYTGVRTGKTIAEYKALIANNANWTSVTNTTSMVTYSGASFGIGNAQTITAHPASKNSCLGNSVTFSVTASDATSFQWQEDRGSGYANVTDGGIYMNATTQSLLITNNNMLMNGYRYRCVVGGSSAIAAVSNSAGLVVIETPIMVGQPNNASIAVGGNTTFMVNATYASTFVWEVNVGNGTFTAVSNGGVYSTATTAILKITGATAAMNGYQYRVLVAGTCSPTQITSNVATLNVGAGPAVTTQPINKNICAGANTSFTVAATNAVSYQWQVHQGDGYSDISNGGIYSGATTATLSITGATAQLNNASYRCIITGNILPTATSAAGILVVGQSPTFSSHPSSIAVNAGADAFFMVSANYGGAYQWQVDTGDGNYTTIANGGKYSGATTDILEITAPSVSMSGYKYRAVVPGCPTNVLSNPGTLNVNVAPEITQPPTDAIICTGVAAIFTLEAQNATGYQWQLKTGNSYVNVSNGGAYSGANTATLTMVTQTTMNGNYYRCVVTGTSLPNAISDDVLLEVEPAPAITTAPANKTIAVGGNTAFVAVVANANSYLWEVDKGDGFEPIANGGVYSGATTSTLSITGATIGMDGYEYRLVAAGGCLPEITSGAAKLTVTGIPSITSQPNDATLCAGVTAIFTLTANEATAYQWQIKDGNSYVNLTNMGVYSGVKTATLTITGSTMAMNNAAYRCVVTGLALPNAISDVVSLNLDPSASITTAPSNKTVTVGGNTSFTAVVANANDYLWEVDKGDGFEPVDNGGVYSNATTTTLVIAGATTAMHNYQYRIMAAGGCLPEVTSSAATLTVNNPIPVINSPTDGAIANTNKPTYSGTATAGSTVTIYVDGSSIGSTTATDGTWSKQQPVALLDGSHSVYAISKLGSNASSGSSLVVNFTTFTTLPVNLIDFVAKIDGNRVRLEWRTAAERRNKYFEVERSTDGVSFSRITKINGGGTTDKPSFYQFYDNLTINGTLYYRLKQYDEDGVVNDLGSRAVNFKISAATEVKIFPNPSAGEFYVAFSDDKGGKANIAIYDISGRKLHSQTLLLSTGLKNYRIVPQHPLAPGQYLLKVLGEELNTTIKFIITK